MNFYSKFIMTDYLIEMLFECILPDQVGALLKDLTSSGVKIVNHHLTSSSSVIDWNDERSIEKIFYENKGFGLFINLKELSRNEICLPNCGIAVYKDEDTINLEINFQLSDLKKSSIKNLAKKLMQTAKSIAIQYQVHDCFCGVEPAYEIETRLFTNEQLGPFSIEI